MNIFSSSYKLHIVFPILTKCEFSGHILLQTLLNLKYHVNMSSGFRVQWDGQMEGGIERNADGWTDMELQILIFATLQTLLKMSFFSYFNKLCII